MRVLGNPGHSPCAGDAPYAVALDARTGADAERGRALLRHPVAPMSGMVLEATHYVAPCREVS